jgi:hypothetical protein
VKTSPIGCDGKQHYTLRSQWGIVEDGMLQRIWGTNRDMDLINIERELDASETTDGGSTGDAAPTGGDAS